MKSITKISKWGNGYGIRLPIKTLKSLQLSEGSEVELIEGDDGIKISSHTASLQDLSLAEIMAGISPDSLAKDKAENFFGEVQGNEIW